MSATIIDFAAWRDRPPQLLPPPSAIEPPAVGTWIRQLVVYPPGDRRGPGDAAEVWHVSSGELVMDRVRFARLRMRCGYGFIVDTGPAPWTIGNDGRAWWGWDQDSTASAPQGRRCGRCVRLADKPPVIAGP